MRQRIKVYANGKRVRQTMVGNRVVKSVKLPRRKMTKTRRNLRRRIRRIGL